MKSQRVTFEEYATLFPDPAHVFNSVEFNRLNSDKCDDVHCLVFADEKGKPRLGIILGERARMFRSPFSAPFGGFDVRDSQRLSFYLEAADALSEYGRLYSKPIIVTFPPSCYDGDLSVFSRQILAVQSKYGRHLFSDFNYHYDLSDFGSFKENIWPNAKRNLAASERQDLEFSYIADPSITAIEEIYGIIRINHESHGYPVHMSLDDVVATAKIIKMDFFIVRKDGAGIAAAIVYHTSHECVQLIYWGDLPDYRACRPMNFMSYNIIRHYAEHTQGSGMRFFDLGPASSDGIPAVGLCDFKESIGCRLTSKVTLTL